MSGILTGLQVVGIREAARDGIMRAITARAAKLGTYKINVEFGGQRGADKNAMIMRVQAAEGRNPGYLPKEFREQIKREVAALAAKPEGWTVPELEAIGSRMIIAILDNVRRQQNKSGASFAPLTETYAANKRKKLGSERPILKFSGDLLSGLHVTVERVA